MDSYDDDSYHQYEKRRLIEAAETTLNRLNDTISSMRNWTTERASLQSDIERLQLALKDNGKDPTSILVSNDPLVKHQSEEIYRLKTTNSNMKTKIKSLSNALLNAERIVTWNVNRKVRSEIAKLNSRNADARLGLAQENVELRRRLDETETSTTFQEIRAEFDELAGGDRHLDDLFAGLAQKVIDTINELSPELLRLQQTLGIFDNNEHITDSLSTENLALFEEQELGEVNFDMAINEKELDSKENFSMNKEEFMRGIENSLGGEIKGTVERLEMEKEFLLKEMTDRINKILMEEELKVKALRKDASSVRVKLTIARMENIKLSKKVEDLEKIQNQNQNNIKTTDLSLEKENEVVKLQSLLELTKEQLKCTNEKLISQEANWNQASNTKEINEELLKVNDENIMLKNKLELERITAREALMQFEKSAKEIEELKSRLENLSAENIDLKKKFSRSKSEKEELKDILNSYKKKHLDSNEERGKEKVSMVKKIEHLKIKLNKITVDFRSTQKKYIDSNTKASSLEEENKNLTNQLNESIKNIAVVTEDLNKLKSQIEEYKNINDDLKIQINDLTCQNEQIENKSEEQRLNNLKINDLLCESKQLNHSLKLEIKARLSEHQATNEEFSKTKIELDQSKSQVEQLLSTISELKTTNEALRSTNAIKDAEVEKLSAEKTAFECSAARKTDDKHESKGTQVHMSMMLVEDFVCDSLMPVEAVEIKEISRAITRGRQDNSNSMQETHSRESSIGSKRHQISGITGDSVLTPREIRPSQISWKTETFGVGAFNEIIKKTKKIDENKLAIDSFKKKEDITISNTRVLKSLEETDRDLLELKSEFAKVKHEIGSLRYELENKRSVMKNIKNENIALKDELAKLRSQLQKHDNEKKINK